MKPYIPFVNTQTDCDSLREYYSDASTVRVSFESYNKIKSLIPNNMKLWFDPAIDSYHQILPISLKDECDRTDSQKKLYIHWEKEFKHFKNYKLLTEKSKWTQSNYDELQLFVFDLLKKSVSYQPQWITLPQLPIVSGGQRNKINIFLAKIAGEWQQQKNNDKYTFVFPIILTHPNQYKNKSTWEKKISQFQKCLDVCNVKYIWIADSSLSDFEGKDNFNERFRKLKEFHSDIKSTFQKYNIIAGPYWGMNMILWAKQLCEHPAISLGTGYQYRISFGFKGRAKFSKIVLPPLRRWASTRDELKTWLDKTLSTLSADDYAYKELLFIKNNFETFKQSDGAKNQMAKFYKQWLDILDKVSPDGRSFALFQDLSKAYAIGKKLPRLPATETSAKDPAKVAEMFMLQCL